jgi:hypothetical protein
MLIAPARAIVTATGHLASALFTAPADAVQTAMVATAAALAPVAAIAAPVAPLLVGTVAMVVGISAYLYGVPRRGDRP